MTTFHSSKTIFITGVSSGFGQAVASAALLAGHRVIGTLRQEQAVAAFEASAPGRAYGRVLDVTEFERAVVVADDVENNIGPVDVLINNAGYGHEGLVEESPLDQMRRQFDVNVFGAVAMTKAFLPRFRGRRRGHVINITSMGGFITMPGIAYYCGSKFALEGFSQALRQEVAQLGLHVTAVAPGSFRTDWAGRSMVRTARSIPDYDPLFDPVRAARQAKSGHQLGDPNKAALAIMKLIEMQDPPAHLLLGSDALGLVTAHFDALRREIAEYEQLTCSTDIA